MSEALQSDARAIIEARGLTRIFMSGGRPLEVLKGIDLNIGAREFVAVVGPSGSGKTTLLGLLAGLDRPTAGNVRVDGRDLGALTEDELALFRVNRIGFVFQTFHLLPTLTALENVLVPVELAGGNRGGVRLTGRAARDHARALLDRAGLGDRAHHYPVQLSGGERQRVALARAFANRPRILFADEPTGNLDADTGSTVVALMEDLNRDAGTTLVLVTHDAELAARAGRVIRLGKGRVVSDAPPVRAERFGAAPVSGQ
ncbi:MAG: ABC transporter ATP-binding protein [Gemmatimonadetes bacterium]|nr:ABC transporter ATP-binding protein [Gemmatimonadota bacterium]